MKPETTNTHYVMLCVATTFKTCLQKAKGKKYSLLGARLTGETNILQRSGAPHIQNIANFVDKEAN